MPTLTPQLFRRLDHRSADPARLFAQVAGQPGAVFLDSAHGEDGLSILALDPEEVLAGEIADTSALRVWLERNRFENAPDVGFPLGGALGFAGYDGRFAFGLYRNFLIHRKQTDEWFGPENLADRFDWSPAAAEPLDPAPLDLQFEPAMSKPAFLDAVETARAYISAGDIYQVNLSQKFEAAWPRGVDPWPLYLALRECSPAPQAAFLNLGGKQILSSSPEQFLKMSGRGIRTRPIKGTRPRRRDPEEDECSRWDLITSEKEQAELIMITDLLRNDLGQVCEFGSVQAVNLLEPEAYQQVHHLVSTIRGELRAEIDHLAAFEACFPGGSITGAPKRRAMQIIEELEPVQRGVYTGAIGYFGLNGESQFSIAIRTAILEGERLHFHVGAGIVADSKPEFEYQETLHKAAGILQAAATLGGARTPRVSDPVKGKM